MESPFGQRCLKGDQIRAFASEGRLGMVGRVAQRRAMLAEFGRTNATGFVIEAAVGTDALLRGNDAGTFS